MNVTQLICNHVDCTIVDCNKPDYNEADSDHIRLICNHVDCTKVDCNMANCNGADSDCNRLSVTRLICNHADCMELIVLKLVVRRLIMSSLPLTRQVFVCAEELENERARHSQTAADLEECRSKPLLFIHSAAKHCLLVFFDTVILQHEAEHNHLFGHTTCNCSETTVKIQGETVLKRGHLHGKLRLHIF